MRSFDHAGLMMILLVGVAVPIGGAYAQRAVPEIQAPVSTSFGTYAPYTVPRYSSEVGLSEPAISPNFSNVVTPANGFPWTSFFSAGERSLLLRNDMVARPEAFGTFAQAYSPTMTTVDLPAFITVDAVVHGLRISAEEAFRVAERDHARPALSSMLNDLSSLFRKQLNSEKNSAISEADRRILAYLQTGQALLDPGTGIDARVGELVDAELQKIHQASGTAASSVVPSTTIDYSRFKPTGYYAADASSSDYYRAKVWLSDVGFPLRGRDGTVDPQLARMAILLARAMDQLAGQGDFRDRYLSINELYGFFRGHPQDVLSWDAMAGATRAYYGRMVTADVSTLADESQLGQFVNYLDEQLPAGRNRLEARTFHLLDRTPSAGDAFFSQAMPGGGQGVGLAIASALGGERAQSLVVAGGTSGAAPKIARAAEDWVQDINWAMLYATQPLITGTETSGGYPRFMRTDAWRDREVTGALGAWADYLHPVSMLPMTTGGSVAKVGRRNASNLGTEGYVEPNPEAWGRIASLAAYIRNGLVDAPNGRMIGEKIEGRLQDIENVSAVMMQISAQELQGKELTDDQIQLLAGMPSRIAAYENFADGGIAGAGAPVVQGGVVSGSSAVADGHPLAIYVIVPRNDGEGGLMLTRGAIYSYFEPTGDLRSWQDAMDNAGTTAVQMPSWMAGFVSTDRNGFAQDTRNFRQVTGSIPATKVAYVPSEADRKRALPDVQLDLESNVVRRSDGELWVTIHAQQLDGVDVMMSVVNTSGQVVYTTAPARIENGERYDVIRVEGLQSGQYFLRVADQVGRQLASGRFMVVR